MKTLQSHQKKMEKKFDEEFVMLFNDEGKPEWGTGIEEFNQGQDIGAKRKEILKNFITSQNKQLYIKITEEEIARLEEIKDDIEIKLIISERKGYQNLSHTLQVEEVMIDEQISHWNNILQELNK